MLDYLVPLLAASSDSGADGTGLTGKKNRADSVVNASQSGDSILSRSNSASSVILQHPSEEALREQRHMATSSTLSIRLLDGGEGESLEHSESQRLLSFSNDHMVVMVNGGDDDNAPADALSSAYRVTNTLLLFFQTAASHRSPARCAQP